jgi:hypothetical protein
MAVRHGHSRGTALLQEDSVKVCVHDWGRLQGTAQSGKGRLVYDTTESGVEAEQSRVGGIAEFRAAAPKYGGQVDVVIGSDIIFDAESAVGVARTVAYFLRPGQVAYIISASMHSRFGVDQFPAALGDAGLVHTTELITDQWLLAGLMPELQYELYTISHRGILI